MKKQDKDFFESLGVKFNGGIGEKYNIFALEQGILIAEALETKDKIIEFKDLDFDEQKKLVPGLSDEHSGKYLWIGKKCNCLLATTFSK